MFVCSTLITNTNAKNNKTGKVGLHLRLVPWDFQGILRFTNVPHQCQPPLLSLEVRMAGSASGSHWDFYRGTREVRYFLANGDWLVVWNMAFIFHNILDNPSQLTNIFQRGSYTSNQFLVNGEHMIFICRCWEKLFISFLFLFIPLGSQVVGLTWALGDINIRATSCNIIMRPTQNAWRS